ACRAPAVGRGFTDAEHRLGARADLARVQTELAEQYPDTDRQVPNALVDRRQQIPSLLSDVCAHDPPVSALTNDD
ncbi:MAG: hypothetical protein DMG00_30490, partial [Acidobacteria bacterium]